MYAADFLQVKDLLIIFEEVCLFQEEKLFMKFVQNEPKQSYPAALQQIAEHSIALDQAEIYEYLLIVNCWLQGKKTTP